jgi:hypothetical protein
MCKFIRGETRKARKAHVCGLCLWPIKKGETYDVSVQSAEGTIHEFKMHSICHQKGNDYFECGDDWTVDFHEFRKEVLGVDPEAKEMPEAPK